jgi:DNA-binding IclR family transcriptional regulator
MQLFTPEHPVWTVESAATEIGVSVSTGYRYVRSLCRAGFLDAFANGCYVLGPAIIEYDRRIRIIDPLIKVGQPVMRRLIAQTNSMGIVLLCRIYRNGVMCVHQEANSLADNTVSYERGRLMPMFRGAPGKVIFANLPSRIRQWYFRNYLEEIKGGWFGSDLKTIKATLRQIRKTGICEAGGEIDRDRVGIAAAIFGSNKSVLGAICMALPDREATPPLIENVSTLVQAAGREISFSLTDFSSEKVASLLNGAWSCRELNEKADSSYDPGVAVIATEAIL